MIQISLAAAGRNGPRCGRSIRRSFASAGIGGGDTTAQPGHRLNVSRALKKSDERQSFGNLTQQPVECLQGIGPKHAEGLHSLNIKTVQQLADYKFFHLARAMTTLAQVEAEGQRLEGTLMNIDKGVDKQFEKMTLNEMILQPVHALQGISPTVGETLASLGVHSVKDLATFKYCLWAESFTVLARFEDSK